MSDITANRYEQDSQFDDYFALLKPRVMRLVVFTAAVGLLVAPSGINPILGIASIMFISLGAGASGALNMLSPKVGPSRSSLSGWMATPNALLVVSAGTIKWRAATTGPLSVTNAPLRLSLNHAAMCNGSLVLANGSALTHILRTRIITVGYARD